jgi:hypothetical protein
MPVLEGKERLQLLVDHHRECSAEMRQCVRVRNRMFIFAVLVLAGITLRSWDSASGERILALALDRVIGAHADVDRVILSVLLWAGLLFVTARYFQTAVHVERYYKHLARLETEMSELLGDELLARESTGYLKDYPLFSDWMHLLYTWMFPLALLAVTIWSIAIEIRLSESAPDALVPVAVGGLAATSTALYIYSSKVESWRRRRRKLPPTGQDGPDAAVHPAQKSRKPMAAQGQR